MIENKKIPFILGGHSFISQLGNDEYATYEEQVEIVNTCLDNGINWFDTTYQPERVRLGKILEETGRREQAKIIVWNFFNDFEPGEEVGGPDYYKPEHLDILLEQVKSNYIDALVVHKLDNDEENAKQQEVVELWLNKGYIKTLGIWCPEISDFSKYSEKNSFNFMVRPFNIKAKDNVSDFEMARTLNWQIFTCSPFVRGWELDKLVAEKASSNINEDQVSLKAKLADLMLRYSMFEQQVDRVIVGMRKKDWILKNIESFSRGPLTYEEKQLLGIYM